MNKKADAVQLLEDWVNEDPSYRRFKITYHGPVRSTAWTWTRGYSVVIWSNRRRLEESIHTAGMTLLQAAQRAVYQYRKQVSERCRRKK